MRLLDIARINAVALAIPSFGVLAAQSTGACAGVTACMETRNIVANVLDSRLSNGSNGLRILTVTIHFTNRSTHPVILGYVNGSGVAIDDQGNRYTVLSAAAVRGIGIINGNKVDAKFSLQPGEGADARFELGWRAESRKIYGTSYSLEMTVREINPINATQLRLGEEYALRFPGLSGDGTGLSAAPVVGATAAAVPAAAPAASAQPVVAAPSTACAGVARCYDAGPFTAVVSSMTGSNSGRNHVIDMNIRFTNRTTQPIILAYTQASSSMIDNLGNRYYWGRAGTHDRSVQGMGMAAGSSADPQFVLRPGESRDAKFSVIRYDVGNKGLGGSFNYDVGIEQLAILPSQQIRSLRQYAVHFDNISTGAAAPNLNDAVSKLKSLFKKP